MQNGGVAPESSDAERVQRPAWWRRLFRSAWTQLVIAFVVFGLFLSFVAKPYLVPSGSMLNTLQVGDRVLVNRLAYPGDNPVAGPRTGDVVVFDADETWGSLPTPSSNPLRAAARWVGVVTGFGPTGLHTLVKRVIAGPGQTVSCCSAGGAVLVDGHPISEPYVSVDEPFESGVLDCDSTPRSARCLPQARVPDGAYLVLGDNRADSADSALHCRLAGSTGDCYRWVQRGQLVGRVVAILWPPGRWAGQP